MPEAAGVPDSMDAETTLDARMDILSSVCAHGNIIYCVHIYNIIGMLRLYCMQYRNISVVCVYDSMNYLFYACMERYMNASTMGYRNII